MFESNQKSTGTRYTTTAGLLIMAFIFCPAVLVASRPVGYVFLNASHRLQRSMRDLAWVN